MDHSRIIYVWYKEGRKSILSDKKKFYIKGVQHLGLAIEDLATAHHFFVNILGLPFVGAGRVDEQKVTFEMIRTKSPSMTVGLEQSIPNIELLKATDQESPIQKYIQKKGTGIHHIAFEVNHIELFLEYLQSKEIRLIDHQPRMGAHNSKVAFIHPKSTGGILVELVEVCSE